MKAGRTTRLATDSDKTVWNAAASHPLQSWQWGEFRQHTGIDVVRVAFYEGNKFAAGWQLTFHKLPFLPFTVGYFPKGPLPTAEMLREISRIGKQKKALFIQIEPDAPFEASMPSNDARLRPSHHPLFTKYTFVLDLTKSEEELLTAMHSKTRYNIRVALKHGVVVREDNSSAAFASYLRLTEETTRRQGFYAHNKMYHTTMWKILSKNNIARLFTATYQGKTIAAWIVFVWKDTVYYPYGASSRDHREVMAPSVLLWEIARWAKKQGLYYFDLWGALGPDPDPDDPWYGFHRFKEGFSPNLIEYVGSYDLVIHPMLYRLYTIADVLRWGLLKFKKR